MRKFSFRATFTHFLISGFTLLLIRHFALKYGMEQLFIPAAVFIYLLGALVFYFWVDMQIEQIVRLNRMAKSFAEGNLNETTLVTSDDEIGELSSSLNVMAGKLNIYIQQTLQEKNQMETILASMVEGVLAFDMVGRLMLMNRTAEEMLEVKWENTRQHYFLEILRNHTLAALLNKVLTDGKQQVIELRLMPTDAKIYRVYITPIKGAKPGQGVIMVLRDVTRLKTLEKMRSDFVANVSHELRTPLTSIKGYVETLLDGALEDKAVTLNFLSIINEESNRLNRLINDLLYLSQLETGQMEVIKEPFEIQKLLESVVRLLNPVAERKNITVNITVDSGAEIIYANQDMMGQVLINLLENAIKYSHDGDMVKIEASRHEEGYSLRVIDQGIGIAPDSLPRLFERFYRVDKARSRSEGGTGLGLSIVKHIVERHSGQIMVDSVENKGTTFSILLPGPDEHKKS